MKKNLLILLICIITSSCQKNIEYYLPFEDNLIIVNGVFSPKESIKVHVHYSRTTDDSILRPIEGLQIALYENNVFLENFGYQGESVYTSSVIPKAEHYYKIEFEYNGHLIWAEDTVPSFVKIDSISVFDPLKGIHVFSNGYILPVTFFLEQNSTENLKIITSYSGYINYEENLDSIPYVNRDVTSYFLNNNYLIYDFPYSEDVVNHLFYLFNFYHFNLNLAHAFKGKASLNVYSKNYSDLMEFITPDNTEQYWMNIGSIREQIYGFESNVQGANAYGAFLAMNGDSISFSYHINSLK